MNSQPGKFIVIEGPDGSGKTTASAFFAELLAEKFAAGDFIRTREIGGTPIAENIRSMMLQSGSEHVTPLSRLLMAVTTREQHLTNVIRPALASGRHVLSDRYNTSTLVYQCEIDGLLETARGLAELPTMKHLFQGPDYILYLSTDFETAFNRGILRKNLDNDVYKNRKPWAQRIHDAYYRLLMENHVPGELHHAYSQDPQTKVIVIDAQTVETMKAGVLNAFNLIFSREAGLRV
jgi:dTMP kinase